MSRFRHHLLPAQSHRFHGYTRIIWQCALLLTAGAAVILDWLLF